MESVGSCKKCGTCCKWTYVSSRDKIYVTDLMSYRGIEKVDDYTIRIPARCRFLGEDNRCGIYKVRPEYCKDFPNVGIMPKECKYYERCIL